MYQYSKPIDRLRPCEYCEESKTGGGTSICREGVLWWRHDVTYIRPTMSHGWFCTRPTADDGAVFGNQRCTILDQERCPLALIGAKS